MTMTKEQWLSERKKGIGGSDISSVLGMNKYKTALMLYNEKLGITSPDDLSNNETVHFGTILEDIVAKEFAARTGKKVRRKNKIIKDKARSYFLANIDREVVGENAVLECKTTSAFNADEWKGDEIPASYILQVKWYMYVGGYSKGYIACLIGGQRFVWKEIERDDDLIEEMTKKADYFWNENILKGIPPEATAMDNSKLKELVQEQDEAVAELPENCVELLSELESTKATIKELGSKKDSIEAKIKQNMGNHKKGIAGSYIVNWSMITRGTFDSKKFQEENPDMKDKYTKYTDSDRLTIKKAN